LAQANVKAVVAYPEPTTVSQPDGTTLTIYLHGDEFLHFATTSDGYTVVRNDNGVYVYARQQDGDIVPSNLIAHDAVNRSAAELYLLNAIPRYLKPAQTEAQRAMRVDRSSSLFTNQARRVYDYKKFKGLVILVEYNNRSFSADDPRTLFDNMINQHDYKGYTTANDTVECTGSVYDYFHDNSGGLFSPQFDVVGPVKIDYSMYYANGTTYARTLVKAACEAVNDQVDFSDYDTDGDGVVDMFYLIFAGAGSNYGNNDSRLIWPHAWSLVGTTLDGVSLSRYACSTELYGPSSANMIDGIGTMCHEFSHVLGLMDEYDTDYTSSGGTSVHPGYWSLMAAGSYLNYSRTPAGYSLFERYQSGFTVPERITATGKYTLKDIDATNSGYMLRTAEDMEYFMIENRRNGEGAKWNEYLPGHGMLVFRVDSTDVSVWTNNKINVNPSHNYYELLRANPLVENSSTTDSDGDPFPGTGNVVELSSVTTPNLKSWSGLPAEFALSEISEDENGVITFNVVKDKTEILLEDFENITTSTNSDSDVQGVFCKWTFTKASVDAPTNSSMCNGQKALAMVRGSIAESSTISGKTKSISLRASNSGSTSATLNILYYNSSTGQWITLVSGTSSAISVSRNATVTTLVEIPEDVAENFKFQIKVIAGSSSSKIWIDDIELIRENSLTSGVETVSLDSNALNVSVANDIITVTSDTNGVVALYDITGYCVARAEIIEGKALITIPKHGFYILHTPNGAMKILY
jgi:M6 family metalloprotease-like protein